MRPNFHMAISELFTIPECFFRSFSEYGSIKKMSRKMITCEKKSHVVRVVLEVDFEKFFYGQM